VHGFRFGIEEEYFVVDRRTAGIRCELPQDFIKRCAKRLGPQFMLELLQSQIEVATNPMTRPADARAELRYFRTALAEIGRQHGIGIVAAGTHPLAMPEQHRMTRKRRYSKVIDDLGMVGLGNALCGLHVHVEVPEPDLRVEIMHRLVPFVPLLLALSTSSPFWAGCETGLLGYRNAANDGMPRTGLPEMFRSVAEYEEYVKALVDAKIIQDATFIWWALRPSLRHPTIELRVTDCCTAVDDAVAIASLYRALVHHVVRHRTLNSEFSAVTRALTEENRWRAQRYGTEGTYVDVMSRDVKSFAVMFEETLALVSDDLRELGIESEVGALRAILHRGTSAHRQLALYRQWGGQGRTSKDAMRAVTKWLRASTEAGQFVDPELQPGPATRATAGLKTTRMTAAASRCRQGTKEQVKSLKSGLDCRGE
jgi:carboxylate-amine ligase